MPDQQQSGPLGVLGYLSEQFAGASSSHIKLEASSARNNLRPSSSVSFTFPQNALINLDSFAVHCKVKVDNGRFGSAHTLLERVEVSMGGAIVSGNSSYANITQSMLEAATGARGDMISEHGVLPQLDGFDFRAYQNGHIVTADKEEVDITFSNWRTGLLGTCGTRIINTARLPVMTVRLTFASDKVLVQNVAGTAATFTIDNIFSTMEVLTISNPALEAMENSIIASKGFLPLCFKEWHTVRSTNQGIVRASISTRSLDRILVAYQLPALDTQGVQIDSFDANIFPAEKAFAACETFCPTGAYLAGADAAAEAVLTASISSELFTHLGGVRYPQYRALFGKEWLKINQDALYDEEKVENLDARSGLVQARQKNVAVVRLNLPGSRSPCYSSGVNSQNQSLIVEVSNTDFLNAITYISCECTSLIMCGAEREISLSR